MPHTFWYNPARMLYKAFRSPNEHLPEIIQFTVRSFSEISRVIRLVFLQNFGAYRLSKTV